MAKLEFAYPLVRQTNTSVTPDQHYRFFCVFLYTESVFAEINTQRKKVAAGTQAGLGGSALDVSLMHTPTPL